MTEDMAAPLLALGGLRQPRPQQHLRWFEACATGKINSLVTRSLGEYRGWGPRSAIAVSSPNAVPGAAPQPVCVKGP